MDAADDILIAALRVTVQDVDEKICRLLQDRLSAVLSIAARKQSLGLPLYDGAREEWLIGRAPEEVRDAYREIITACRLAARAACRPRDITR